MKRSESLQALETTEFDVLVIGGGIFGACAAREASKRGLKVALIEKRDFASGSSSQHFKMLHGGIRYLQHGDLVRVRESIDARRFFFKTLPHLVDPLPIIIPTYTVGTPRWMLAAGVFVYDAVALDRNWGVQASEKHIPGGKVLSKADVVEAFPEIDQQGLTGGVLFYDGQMYNPCRIVVSYVRDADENGAVICNYLNATKILEENGLVQGAEVLDELSGKRFTIRSKSVLNAAGGWAHRLINESLGSAHSPNVNFSRDACFLVKRQISKRNAVAVLGQSKDPDALVSRGARHLFVVPWRDYSLVGVWHVVKKDKPEDVYITRQEIETFIEEVNAGYKGLNIQFEDVTISNWGLTLFGENTEDSKDLSYGKRSVLINHAKEQGLKGLVTLIGVRATTSGVMAVQAVNEVEAALNISKSKAVFDSTPAWGGTAIDKSVILSQLDGNAVVADTLYRNYGAGAQDVLAIAGRRPELKKTIDGTHVLAAEIVHAIETELAVKLVDVVLRRTEIGNAGCPSEQAITQCADVMAQVLNWTEEEKLSNIKELKDAYPNIRL
ncbi:MAG: glycerol-3-phosphate dehydrogenase/oxidase [Ketobacter sp.]